MWSRQDHCGSYPSSLRAFWIESSVSKSPAVGWYGTAGNTSAINSRLGRFMTVSAGSDDEVLGADVGLEREPATLGDVARVDVAPQIPASQLGSSQ